MMITNEGTIIRTNVSGINVYSRTATGVILMRLNEGGYLKTVARLEKCEDIEKETAEIDKEIENTPKREAVPDSSERMPLDEEDSF